MKTTVDLFDIVLLIILLGLMLPFLFGAIAPLTDMSAWGFGTSDDKTMKPQSGDVLAADELYTDDSMTDAVTKVIGILLAFVLLVLAPMTISRMRDDMATRRMVLNEVTAFIDKVTDKGSITGTDADDLMIEVNAYGGAFDVRIVRYIRVAVKDISRSEEVRSIYYATDDVFTGEVLLNVGDVVQVRAEGITKPKGQNLLEGLLQVAERPFLFTLAGAVR